MNEFKEIKDNWKYEFQLIVRDRNGNILADLIEHGDWDDAEALLGITQRIVERQESEKRLNG